MEGVKNQNYAYFSVTFLLLNFDSWEPKASSVYIEIDIIPVLVMKSY